MKYQLFFENLTTSVFYQNFQNIKSSNECIKRDLMLHNRPRTLTYTLTSIMRGLWFDTSYWGKSLIATETTRYNRLLGRLYSLASCIQRAPKVSNNERIFFPLDVIANFFKYQPLMFLTEKLKLEEKNRLIRYDQQKKR